MGSSRLERILEGDEDVIPQSRVEKLMVVIKTEIDEIIEHGGGGDPSVPITKEEIQEIIDNAFNNMLIENQNGG